MTLKTRWERAQYVADRLGVTSRAVRKWAQLGYVESRVEGPRLVFIRVHDGGEFDGRPVGLDEALDPSVAPAA
jgi:hypothetical protein